MHRYFSRADISTADRLAVPFYLADYTGFLKVYCPEAPAYGGAHRRGRSSVALARSVSRGTIVRDDEENKVRVRVRVHKSDLVM